MSDPAAVDEAQRELGRALAGWRAAAGLTQHQLAPLINYGRSTVANVEVGRQRPPRRFWERCDAVLTADGSLVAAYDDLLHSRQNAARRSLVAQTADVFSRDPVAVEESEGGSMRRRELLALTAVRSADAAFGGRRIGREDVRRRVARTARLRRLDNFLGGGESFALYAAELRTTMALAKTSTYSSSTGRELSALIAEQTQLAGWAAFDAGRHDAASSMFMTSRSVAREVGDRALAANALALLAYQRASLGRPRGRDG